VGSARESVEVRSRVEERSSHVGALRTRDQAVDGAQELRWRRRVWKAEAEADAVDASWELGPR
jgi:hypothetical protein